MSFACGAAALPARSHVRVQPLAGGEVLIPADIAGMMIGQADSPLLEWQHDPTDPHLPACVEVLLFPGSSERERSRVGNVTRSV